MCSLHMTFYTENLFFSVFIKFPTDSVFVLLKAFVTRGTVFLLATTFLLLQIINSFNTINL